MAGPENCIEKLPFLEDRTNLIGLATNNAGGELVGCDTPVKKLS
jgi:hypothetical protein